MARKLFFVDLDLNGNQIKKVALEVLSSAPETNLVAGRTYFDSTSNTIKIYDGSNWQTILRSSDVINEVTAGSSAPVTSGAVASAIAGLSGAMHFIDVLPVVEGKDFADALTTYKSAHPSYVEAAGDIFTYGTKEYVYNGTDWCELGDETIVVTSFGGQTGAITVRGSQLATGSVNLSMSGNELQATLVMPIGSDIILTGYTKAGAKAAVTDTDNVNQAIGKLEKNIEVLEGEVLKNEETTSTALNDLNTRVSGLEGEVLENEETTSAALNDLNKRLLGLKGEVLENEETTSAALNDLNKRLLGLEGGAVKKYVTSINSDSGTHTSTIQASTHGCGTDPLVSCFYDGEQVIIDQAIDASGNVTISWAAATVVNAQHPIKVVMMG